MERKNKWIEVESIEIKQDENITVADVKKYLNNVEDSLIIGIGQESYKELSIVFFKIELESEEEFEIRKKSAQEASKIIKKNRYEYYLKLKEEFESENL